MGYVTVRKQITRTQSLVHGLASVWTDPIAGAVFGETSGVRTLAVDLVGKDALLQTDGKCRSGFTFK